MMAHAIDLVCADRRPTPQPRNARAIGMRSGGFGAPGAGHATARQRLSRRHDRYEAGCSSRTIVLWKQRFAKDGLAGLVTRQRGSKPTVLTPTRDVRIMTWTHPPPSPRPDPRVPRDRSAATWGVQQTIVARTWHQASLQPRRLEHYLRSTDPECETKAADVIGLYLKPPQHVVVFCVNEKTTNQALDRLDPVLPFPPGRAPRPPGTPARNWSACSRPLSRRGPAGASRSAS